MQGLEEQIKVDNLSSSQSMQRRYQELHLRDAILRRNDYVEACKELQGVAKAVYVNTSKPLQALIFEDILHAFRTLPQLETSRQLAAAKLLLHTVEDVFPKHRRAAAAQLYKSSIIAWHRQFKNREPLPEYSELSGDILLHVFEYLDACSLATASAVCRAWNVAANDDRLWHRHFLSLFGTSKESTNSTKVHGVHKDDGGAGQIDRIEQLLQEQHNNSIGIWRKAFHLARKGRSSALFMSNRGQCQVCKEIIWLAEPPYIPAKGKCVARKQILDHHSPKPLTPSQVVRYVANEDMISSSDSSSSDSGEDEDDNPERSFFRLWNVPKQREMKGI